MGWGDRARRIGLGVAVAAALAGAPTSIGAADASSGGPAPLGPSPAIHHALVARQAFSTRPVRFLLVGDSLALTLGIGLSEHSVPRDGVDVLDRAVLGCDLDPGLSIETAERPGPATPGCQAWTTGWSRLLEADHPAVVGLLLGRWENCDHFYGGTWVHTGDPSWDAHLTADLVEAVHVLSSRGARVVLFTEPYLEPPLPPGSAVPYPENQPTRVDRYNQILRSVAASLPGVATVIDLNRLLDPDGHFTLDVKSTRVRWFDGIHISLAGGEQVQPDVLPTVARLGLVPPVRTGPPGTGG